MALNKSISCATWNCRGVKHKTDYLKEFIHKHNADIICLQETWLRECEEKIVCDLLKDYQGVAISSINSGIVLRGRPFGGLATLWKASISPLINVIQESDNRLLCIMLNFENESIMLVNCYLPTADNPLEQNEYFAKILSLYEKSEASKIIIAGDLNCDPSKHDNYRVLQEMCNAANLRIRDVEEMCKSTYTYSNDALTVQSWIDHVIVSDDLAEMTCDFATLAPTPSDHLILTFKVNIDFNDVETFRADHKKTIRWKTASDKILLNYRNNTMTALNAIRTKLEQGLYHHNINELYNNIVECLAVAEEKAATIRRHKKNAVPGWNDNVRELHQKFKDAYYNWTTDKSSQIKKTMLNSCKAEFKYALRKCERKRKQIEADKLATLCHEKEFNTFWKNVKKSTSGKNISISNTVNNVSGQTNICRLWKNHFKELFDSNRDISDLVIDGNFSDFTEFTENEVKFVCDKLDRNKAEGPDNICTENVVYAHENIYYILTELMNLIVKHSTLPSALIEVKIVPIVKKKGLNATKVGNYRPIALATCFSKILEKLLLTRSLDKLDTEDNQFGYKKKIGTEMAIFTLKQVISHYIENDTPVYVVCLDASQAFNKVDHRKLLLKLIERGMPSFFINLMISWFDTQKFFISWGKTRSESFSVYQGVRQGGILSAFLFAVYIDELSLQLNSLDIGAQIGGVRINHLMYADDISIITTTVSSMEKLLKHCDNYANNHNLQFNSSKTEFQSFIPCYLQYLKDKISVQFLTSKLCNTQSLKYLGYDIANKIKYNKTHLDDEPEIKKRVNEIYKRAYMIRSFFSACSRPVKVKLFKTYFGNIYCCSVWNKIIKRNDSIRVAHNDALRIIFGLNRRCSASEAFVSRGIGNINFVIRRCVYSLKIRATESSNNLIRTIMYNKFNSLTNSKLHKLWNDILYANNNVENTL